MFANPFVGIFEFMDVCILYCAFSSMEFCMLIFYILLCSISLVQYISSVGLVLTRGFQEFWLTGAQNQYAFCIECIAILFYLVAITISFYAYREFKALVVDSMGGGTGAGQGFPFQQR